MMGHESLNYHACLLRDPGCIRKETNDSELRSKPGFDGRVLTTGDSYALNYI